MVDHSQNAVFNLDCAIAPWAAKNMTGRISGVPWGPEGALKFVSNVRRKMTKLSFPVAKHPFL